MEDIALLIVTLPEPAPASAKDETLKLSLSIKVESDLKVIQLFANPCCKLVVVELPSPVTAIDPAVDVPVSVFTLSSAIVYPKNVTPNELYDASLDVFDGVASPVG